MIVNLWKRNGLIVGDELQYTHIDIPTRQMKIIVKKRRSWAV